MEQRVKISIALTREREGGMQSGEVRNFRGEVTLIPFIGGRGKRADIYAVIILLGVGDRAPG